MARGISPRESDRKVGRPTQMPDVYSGKDLASCGTTKALASEEHKTQRDHHVDWQFDLSKAEIEEDSMKNYDRASSLNKDDTKRHKAPEYRLELPDGAPSATGITTEMIKWDEDHPQEREISSWSSSGSTLVSWDFPGELGETAPADTTSFSHSVKKHKCPYCSAEFTRHHNLKSHLLTHSQEKPYVCQTCQARFRRLYDLKRHAKLHVGERPHTCPKCGRRFARGESLARHDKGLGGCEGRRATTDDFGSDDNQIARRGESAFSFGSLDAIGARSSSCGSLTDISRPLRSKETEFCQRSKSEPPRSLRLTPYAERNYSEPALKSPYGEFGAPERSGCSPNACLIDLKVHRPNMHNSRTPQNEDDALLAQEVSKSPLNSPREEVSDDSLSSANGTPSVLMSSNWRLLSTLMSDFYALFSYRLPLSCYTCAGDGAVHNSGFHIVDQNGGNESGSRISRMKRKIVGENGSAKDDDQQSDRKRPRSNDGSSAPKHGRGLFACPFFKYNPRKYTCNSDTGIRYRSCAGPGWESIARLKQHLKRSHAAPIHCPRCWILVKDQLELSTHMRAARQCEVLPPQSVEGIPGYRMEMIKGRHGATWKDIYEIIFPGAPVPCCHYDINTASESIPAPQSPDSTKLAEFEAYSLTELPRLVEANLEAMIQAETKPIEAKMKELLVEIVRRCQSTISQRWEMLAPSGDNKKECSQDALPLEAFDWTPFPESTCGGFPGVDPSLIRSAFDEPPPIAYEGMMTLPEASNIYPQSQTDSGYGSVNYFCNCNVSLPSSQHTASESSSMAPTSSHDPGAMPPSIDSFGLPSDFRSGESLWTDAFSIAAGPEEASKVVAKCPFCRGWLFVS